MEENPKPHRRWYRFSLRTMLVLVTLVCLLCGYLGWAMNWIRQRQVFLKTQGIVGSSYFGAFKDAPFAIRLLGEKGCKSIWVIPGQEEKGRELFPEAEIQEIRPRKSAM